MGGRKREREREGGREGGWEERRESGNSDGWVREFKQTRYGSARRSVWAVWQWPHSLCPGPLGAAVASHGNDTSST